MNRLKETIPNAITAFNLIAGLLAVIAVLENNLLLAAVFVVAGIIFDFFDGFAARILEVKSELGKQLDSLADLVTSGVVPGLTIFMLLNTHSYTLEEILKYNPLPLIGLLITVGAAFRLAYFNIDTRQADHFIGLPTPASALLVLSIPCMLAYPTIPGLEGFLMSPYFLIGLSVFLPIVMNAQLELFSLKFDHFGWEGNQIRYAFLLVSIGLIGWLHFTGMAVVILLYILSGIIIKSPD